MHTNFEKFNVSSILIVINLETLWNLNVNVLKEGIFMSCNWI